MDGKSIALVIATYERAAPLARLLQCLAAQSLPAAQWELIVVVDGGSDRTPALLAAEQARGILPLRYEVQPNAGPAAARHRGIQLCTAPRVILLDDDMEVGPEFLVGHGRAAEAAPSATVVLGRIVAPPDWQQRPLHDALGEFGMMTLHERFAAGESRPSGASFISGNVSFPRTLYLAAGGFDPAFRIDEDRELGHRLAARGALFAFSADAWSVHHSDLGTFAHWASRQVNYGKTALRVYEKHGRDPDLHPLRNFVAGHRLNRQLVLLVCPWPPLARVAVTALRAAGAVLQTLGAYHLALDTHKAIAAVLYHLGLREALGTWRRLRDAADALRRDPRCPKTATNR